jgi:hypothetical protein
MARIIPFRRDEHREVQLLLPWYAKDRLDPEDRARVETHLAACAECAVELKLEQTLAAEIADLPIATEQGWTRIRRRVARRRAPWRDSGAARRAWRRSRKAVAWSAVASALVVTALAATTTFRSLEAPRYRTLASREATGPGSLVVIFRPDAREDDLRRLMLGANLRIVDGPTAAGAYVLRAPPSQQAASLGVLRHDPKVLLAQPIDAGTDQP